jgi:outer membrane protein TolC
MGRFSTIFLLVVGLIQAETYTLSLKQVMTRAMAQNPDVALARLDEQKAVQATKQARDPFSPKVFAGSGLAYSSGFPLSINGAVPSIFQTQATQDVFNRQQSYQVAEARENVRGAGFATASKRDEVVYRAAALYIDADRAARLSQAMAKHLESLGKVAQTVAGRVQEGRELPIEIKRANLELAKAKQRAASLADDAEYAQRSLAVLLGYSSDDMVKATDEERALPKVPDNEQAAIEAALEGSHELKRLQSAMLAKGLEVKSQNAARLPKLDLLAEYAVLARYNNYDKFFKAFQRNNGQLGVSFQIPILVGPGIKANVAQAETDTAKLRIEMEGMRNRISLQVRQSYQDIRKADDAREVSQADLELARESLTVLLAQLSEGRVALRQVEEARILESEKWAAFYDAQFLAEKARLNLLRETGDLVASIQ